MEMTIYIILVVFSILVGLLLRVYKQNSKNRKKYSVIMALFVGAVIGFRALTIGTDTIVYYNLFYRLENAAFNWGDFAETQLFYILIKVFQSIGLSYNSLKIATGFIFSISIAYVMHKLSDNLIISWMVFICSGLLMLSMNISRQCLSIGIVLVAFVKFKEKKFRLAVILFIIAVLLHNVTLFALVFWPISKIKLNYKSIAAGVALAFMGKLLFNPAIYFFVRLFPAYSRYLDPTWALSIFHRGSNSFSSFFGFNLKMISILFILILSMFVSSQKVLSDEKSKHITEMSPIIALYIMSAMAFGDSAQFIRIVLPIQFLFVVYSANVIQALPGKGLKPLFATGFVLMLNVRFVLSLMIDNVGKQEFVPYSFFWMN